MSTFSAPISLPAMTLRYPHASSTSPIRVDKRRGRTARAGSSTGTFLYIFPTTLRFRFIVAVVLSASPTRQILQRAPPDVFGFGVDYGYAGRRDGIQSLDILRLPFATRTRGRGTARCFSAAAFASPFGTAFRATLSSMSYASANVTTSASSPSMTGRARVWVFCFFCLPPTLRWTAYRHLVAGFRQPRLANAA